MHVFALQLNRAFAEYNYMASKRHIIVSSDITLCGYLGSMYELTNSDITLCG